MKHEKILLVGCLLIGLATVSYAQGIGAPIEKAKGLQKELKLTDVQTTKIANIYKETAEKCEKIKKDAHGNANKIAKSIPPLRAATIKKIRSILTADQATKFNVLVKQTKNGDASDFGVVCY